jgi:adenylate cyclase
MSDDVGQDQPRSLRELAERLGVPEAEVAEAEAEGTLALLVVEHLAVSDPPVYTQPEVVERSALGAEANRFWRALGFPDPAQDEPTFSAVDLEMLDLVEVIIRMKLIEHDAALQLARVIGSSMQRVAQAQVDAIDARLQSDHSDAVDPELAVQRVQLLLPTMPRVLEYAWRRHLQSAVRQRLMREHPEEGPVPRAVGFADLVGFTSISQQLDDQQLIDVVDRFETTAFDIVTSHGGRVVKMIGDEVMFEVGDIAAAALVAVDLANAFHSDEAVNDVRVGLAYGPAVAREGDLFGSTVNLAARMVGIAYAGSVVCSSEVRDALAEDERFAFRSLRGRYLKHIGRVQLYTLRRAGDTGEGLAERARRRRDMIGDRITELAERTVAARATTEDTSSPPD